MQYSSLTGLTYIGNLLVGTGALALPKAFQDAGYALGVLALVFLAFMSYLNATYVVEALSVYCAINKMKKTKAADVEDAEEDAEDVENQFGAVRRRVDCVAVESYEDEKDYPEHFYDISGSVELGAMASEILGRFGWMVFYACIVLYLFGDLAIYGAVVPKSLVHAVCTYAVGNDTSQAAFNLSSTIPCWSESTSQWSRFAVYRLLIVAFGLACGPFVFFGMSRTKYFQFVASFMRWFSFSVMIIWSLSRVAVSGSEKSVKAFNFNQFMELLGTAIYSFMCHHSLPGVVIPMKRKGKIHLSIFGVYSLILVFYLFLSISGSLAFHRVEDVYVLNFFHLRTEQGRFEVAVGVLRYFLLLYPVFTISSNYPIIAITLRNNMDFLLFSTKRCATDGRMKSHESREVLLPDQTSGSVVFQEHCRVTWLLRRVLLPILVITLPLSVALLTDNVETLISITASYAGVGIQYIIPSWIALSIRRNFSNVYQSLPAQFASPFRSQKWVCLSFCWALFSILIVSVNLVSNYKAFLS